MPAHPGTGAPNGGFGPPWLWPLVSAVLLVLAIGALLTAQTNASNGNRWKSQAVNTAAQVQPLQDKLTASEAAYAKAESRTTKLANEKAQAEDKLTIRSVLPENVNAVATALETCASDTRDLLNSIASAQSVGELNGLGQQANEVALECERAQAGADSLVGFLRDQSGKK